MSDNLDEYLAELQARCDAEARDLYGDASVARWQAPPRRGRLEHPDAVGTAGSGREAITVYLRLDKGRVAQASYTTDGCGPSQICGDAAAELASGARPEELAGVTESTIIERLGKLPEQKHHCARIAARALARAAAALAGETGRKEAADG